MDAVKKRECPIYDRGGDQAYCRFSMRESTPLISYPFSPLDVEFALPTKSEQMATKEQTKSSRETSTFPLSDGPISWGKS